MSRRCSPHHAIFDLAHLSTLSGEPGLALFVSPRTLYCLQNLVIQDVTDLSRYAVAVLEDGWYDPVQPADPEWETMQDVREGIEAEVYQMPIYAYVDVYSKRTISYPASAGTYIVTYVVPAGELWEMQALSGANVSRAQPMKIDCADEEGSTSVMLKQETPASATDWVVWQGKLVLKSAMRVRFVFYGAETGDSIYTEIHLAKLVPL